MEVWYNNKWINFTQFQILKTFKNLSKQWLKINCISFALLDIFFLVQLFMNQLKLKKVFNIY